jgi:small subunit ribosomal protein S6e
MESSFITFKIQWLFRSECFKMAKFKVIVSDPEEGKSSVVELEESRAAPFIGRRIGETIDGTVLGLSGHKVVITGGSDKSGFPMRPDVHGGIKSRILIGRGVGFKPSQKNVRRRKTIRGNIVTDDIAQINVKITEKPAEKPAKKPKKAEEKSEPAKKQA